MTNAITGNQPTHRVERTGPVPVVIARQTAKAIPAVDHVRLQVLRRDKMPPLFDTTSSKSLDAGALAAAGFGAVAAFGAGAVASGVLTPVAIKDAALASRRAFPALSGLTLAAVGSAGLAGGLVARKSDTALGSIGLGALAGTTALAGTMAAGMLLGGSGVAAAARSAVTYGAFGMAAGGVGGLVEHLFHRTRAE